MQAKHEKAAVEFLAAQLKDYAPATIAHQATFEGSPLEGEGAMSVFRFRATVGGGEPADYWVVAGQTEPNYYPHWGLDAEQVYETHLGTRFMLVLGVAVVPLCDTPDDHVQRVAAFIASAAPGAAIENIEPAAIFRVQDGVYGVFRARVGGDDVYILGLDCPPGIYRDTNLPPHVVFRRHIGRLIRREVQAEQRDQQRRAQNLRR